MHKPYLYLICWCISAACNAQNIIVQEVSILPINSNRASSEGVMSLNKHNKDHLIASFLTSDPDSRPLDYHTEVWETFDRGQNWLKVPREELREAADPWGQINDDGSLLITDISEGSKFHLKTQIYEKGKWSAPISHGFGHDHAMTIRLKTEGEVILISSQKDEQGKSTTYWANSVNGGRTFTKTKSIRLFQGVEYNAKQPVMTAAGEIKVPIVVREQLRDNENRALEKMSTWLFTFSAEGEVLGPPQFVTENSGRKHHWLVATSNNRLTYAYTNKDRNRLEIINSEEGDIWADPVRLDDGLDSDALINLDAMVTDAIGRLAVVWTRGLNGVYQKYISVSLDGGFSFLPKAILGRPYRPSEKNDWVGRAWPQGGDYCGLIAHPDNHFYVMWSTPENELFQPRFAKISIK